MQAIAEVKQKLVDYRKQIRKTLCNYSLDYVTVSGTQVCVPFYSSCIHIKLVHDNDTVSCGSKE